MSTGVAVILGVTVELSCAAPLGAADDARFPGSLVEDDASLVAQGAQELLRWTREQAVSVTMHRHGNLITARDGRRPAH